jgi:hypothetical protein
MLVWLCSHGTQHRAGVTLESSQGDFAEWHRRREGEAPFQEGDVVGFDAHGHLTRRTDNASMVGIVSRRAVRKMAALN